MAEKTGDGESMGADTHAHQDARKMSREHIWAIHQRLLDTGGVPMWTVYRPPYRDYGDCYVAVLWRCHPIREETPYVFAREDLDALRLLMPPTCGRLAPAPNDGPGIVEVWI